MFFGSATLYSFFSGSFSSYIPNIPLLVFSLILPMVSSLNTAFFSPGFPFLLGSIFVTVELYIFPSFTSNICPVVFSIISCPRAPNNFVCGSIYVSVPIPFILSFTYNPVLYTLFSSFVSSSVV